MERDLNHRIRKSHLNDHLRQVRINNTSMAEQQNNNQMSDARGAVDGSRMGSNYSNKAQVEANEMDFSAVKKKAHDPHPERSSRRAAVKTYKDYAAESLRKGGGSLTKMILAEREKERNQERRSPANPKNLAMSSLAIIFGILGVGLVAGTYYFVSVIQNDVQQRNGIVVAPQPLLLYDYREEIRLPQLTRSRITSAAEDQIAETAIEAGALKYIYLTTIEANQPILVTASQLLQQLQTTVSSTFLRTLGDNFMYGIFSSLENGPFLIFQIDSYEVAYAAMLDWEQSLGLEMGAFMGRDSVNFALTQFVDIELYNLDIRAVLDTEGEILLGYTFLDRNTLVLFNNKQTIREILERSQRNTIKR